MHKSHVLWFCQWWVVTTIICRHTFIPVAKCNRVSVLIGDNLLSHFSPEVLRLSTKHMVNFIFMPSNCTEKTHQLDVAFFHTMKVTWRKILNEWKTAHLKEYIIPKSISPSLMKRLIESLRNENLLSDFIKTGIYLLDRNKVVRNYQTTMISRKSVNR